MKNMLASFSANSESGDRFALVPGAIPSCTVADITFLPSRATLRKKAQCQCKAEVVWVIKSELDSNNQRFARLHKRITYIFFINFLLARICCIPQHPDTDNGRISALLRAKQFSWDSSPTLSQNQRAN